MRRRQIFQQRFQQLRSNPPAAVPSAVAEAPEPSQNEPAAPVAYLCEDIATQFKDVLSYRSKSGSIVSVKTSEMGLLMWTGSQWVPAHVVPTRRA